MPDVRNCKRCGRIFNYIGGAPLCTTCRDQDEEEFKRIKEYLYNNPRAQLSIVSTELDISIEKIKRFLKEGRLEIVGDEPNFILECESCGKSIKSGRFCDTCERDIKINLRTTAKNMDRNNTGNDLGQNGTGMRFLSKDIKKFIK